MPLLRLLHQISNMYQNVKETQMELREQQPEVTKRDSQPLSTGAPLASSHSGTGAFIHPLWVFLSFSFFFFNGLHIWWHCFPLIECNFLSATADPKVTVPSYNSSGPSNVFPRSHSQVKVTSPSGSIRSSSLRSASMQSASVRSTLRHQSLAQKLRSTSKSVKGVSEWITYFWLCL